MKIMIIAVVDIINITFLIAMSFSAGERSLCMRITNDDYINITYVMK